MEVKTENSEVFSLLEEYRIDRNDEEIKKKFFLKAINFAISVEHCFICNYPDLAEELIFCYSLAKSNIIKKLLDLFEKQLFNCTLCIDTYYRVKNEFLTKARATYGNNAILNFEESLRCEDIRRIERCTKAVLKRLSNSSLTQPEMEAYKSCGNNVLYEVFQYPELLRSYSVNSAIIKLFHFLKSKNKLEIIKKFHPGVFICAFHQNEEIREWIKSLLGISIKNLTIQDYRLLRPYIKNLFDYKKVIDERYNASVVSGTKERKLFKSLKNYGYNDYFCFVEDPKIIYRTMLSIIQLMDRNFLFSLQNDIPNFFQYICTETFERPDNNPIFAMHAICHITSSLKNRVWGFEEFKPELILLYFEKLISYEKYQHLMKERMIDLQKEAFLLTWMVFYIQSSEGILSNSDKFLIWKKIFYYYRDWAKSSRDKIDGFMQSYLQQLRNLENSDDFASMILENIYSFESLSFFFDHSIKKFFIEDVETIMEVHQYSILNRPFFPTSQNDKNVDELKMVKTENNSMNIDASSKTETDIDANKPDDRIHSLTWISFFKRFDLLMKLPEVFSEVIEIVSKLLFIYSENHNHNYDKEAQASFIINIYLNFIKQLISHPILKKVFYHEDTIDRLIQHILSPHLHLSEISYKLLENLTNKKNRNDALNTLFNTFPDQCATTIKNILHRCLSTKVTNDEYCLFYTFFSITNFINYIVLDIEADKNRLPAYLKSDDLLIYIFNFIHVGFIKTKFWMDVIEHDVFMNFYNQLLNTFSIIINSIDNKGEYSSFHQIAPELDRYIKPLFLYATKEQEEESYSLNIIIKILLLYTLENVSISESIITLLFDHEKVKNKSNYSEFYNLCKIQCSSDPDKVKLYEQSQIRVKREDDESRRRDTKESESNILFDMEFLLLHLLIWRYGDRNKYDKITFTPFEKLHVEFHSKEEYIKYGKNLLLNRCWLDYLNAREITKDNQNINLTIRNIYPINKLENVQFSTTYLNLIESQNWKENDVIWISLIEVKNKKKYTYIYDLSCFVVIRKIRKLKFNEAIIDCVVYLRTENNFLYSYFSRNSRWKGQKVFSIDSIVKEYALLKDFDNIPFNKSIIKPSLVTDMNNELNNINNDNFKKTYEQNSKIVDKVLEILKKENKDDVLNENQIDAVKSSIINDKGITLIQGASGTGKSYTIVSIITTLFLKNIDNISNFKILVCTPNSRSCDNLILLLQKQMHTNFNIVRFNDEDSNEIIHPKSIEYTFETLVINKIIEVLEKTYTETEVFKKLGPYEKQTIESLINYKKDIANKKEELGNVVKRIKFCKDKGISLSAKEEAEHLKFIDELYSVIENRNSIFQNIYRFSKKYKDLILEWKEIASQEIIQEHNIAVCPNTICNLPVYQQLRENNSKYNVLIMDDADEFVELNVFIPFYSDLDKVILVGNYINRDKNWINKPMDEMIKENTFFNRAIRCSTSVICKLTQQYRTNKDIISFFNYSLYKNKIVNAMEESSSMESHSSSTNYSLSSTKRFPKVSKVQTKKENPFYRYKLFFNYQFYDVPGYEIDIGKSIYNSFEIDAIFNIVNQLLVKNPDHFYMNKIAIITPYIGQVKMLKNKFSENYGIEVLNYLEISTLEEFKYNEIEIIIFSCVLSDFEIRNRLQSVYTISKVLLKAINSLVIVGNSKTLREMDFWRYLINDAKDRKRFTYYNDRSYPPYMKMVPKNIYPFYDNTRSFIKENDDLENDRPIEYKKDDHSDSSEESSVSLDQIPDSPVVHEDYDQLNAYMKELEENDRPLEINVNNLEFDSDSSDDEELMAALSGAKREPKKKKQSSDKKDVKKTLKSSPSFKSSPKKETPPKSSSNNKNYSSSNENNSKNSKSNSKSIKKEQVPPNNKKKEKTSESKSKNENKFTGSIFDRKSTKGKSLNTNDFGELESLLNIPEVNQSSSLNNPSTENPELFSKKKDKGKEKAKDEPTLTDDIDYINILDNLTEFISEEQRERPSSSNEPGRFSLNDFDLSLDTSSSLPPSSSVIEIREDGEIEEEGDNINDDDHQSSSHRGDKRKREDGDTDSSRNYKKEEFKESSPELKYKKSKLNDDDENKLINTYETKIEMNDEVNSFKNDDNHIIQYKKEDTSKDRDRNRDKSRDRSRERSRDRNRDRSRDRSRDKSRDRSRDKYKDREREKEREKGKERERDKYKDYDNKSRDKNKYKYYSSERRIWDRSRDYYWDESKIVRDKYRRREKRNNKDIPLNNNNFEEEMNKHYSKLINNLKSDHHDSRSRKRKERYNDYDYRMKKSHTPDHEIDHRKPDEPNQNINESHPNDHHAQKDTNIDMNIDDHRLPHPSNDEQDEANQFFESLMSSLNFNIDQETEGKETNNTTNSYHETDTLTNPNHEPSNTTNLNHEISNNSYPNHELSNSLDHNQESQNNKNPNEEESNNYQAKEDHATQNDNNKSTTTNIDEDIEFEIPQFSFNFNFLKTNNNK